MCKIGRNEPCPCGSGEKYKRCCGRHNDNNMQNISVNNELYQAHQKLISYTTTKYKREADEQYTLIESAFELKDEMKEIYRTGVTPWIVSSSPSLTNKETILKQFYYSIEKKLSPHSRELLNRWLNVEPSIYEVISINSPKHNFVQISELGSQDTYTIPYQNEDDFSGNILLIGSLVPFVNHYDFLLTMVKLIPEDISAYTDLLERYKATKEGIKNLFPQLLVDVLLYYPVETNEDWKKLIHKEIAEIIGDHFNKKGMEKNVIDKSISDWNMFCTLINPTIKKVEPYAAAMDYYTRKNILRESQVKQAEIAREYNTSASTLSNIYRRIFEAL